ncbi:MULTISPECIES: helix-turn-helix domain-containing protein [Tenacibaculum]|uniref:Helix-turn-helix domain-containing protein n=1 Tax=Tenacibaculum larymnensis TaxID=2878201 RepID=A0A9X4EL99_9FLAO|nr:MULTISPECIES: helix-turn-helix domain-containing protein [Tenacibaculum]MDE1206031.1 helix-turn-helix domain-containing protein [Tenacibaculum larymnensis]RLK06711.1 excisionase family DNA binding protein [Tenacibaculum discolor]
MDNPFEKINLQLEKICISLEELKEVNKIDNNDKIYSVTEASLISKCSKQTIRNLVKKGKIKATRMGRKILIPHSELFNPMNDVKSLKYKR